MVNDSIESSLFIPFLDGNLIFNNFLNLTAVFGGDF